MKKDRERDDRRSWCLSAASLQLPGFAHRITEWFGLEGTLRGHPAQPPCREQGYLQLDQVAQSPIQPGLECFQGWGTYHLAGQPVPVPHHPQCKICLPSVFFASILPAHSIIEWFGLEGTLKIIWFQPSCHGQGHLPPDQVAGDSRLQQSTEGEACARTSHHEKCPEAPCRGTYIF